MAGPWDKRPPRAQPPSGPRPGADRPRRHPAASRDPQPAVPAAARSEVRLYGLNAVDAVFRRRPDAIRKLYLVESRIPALKPLLAWCVKHRVGYRVVEEGDLERLAASSHHEGVVADVLRVEPQPLDVWLHGLGPAALALWLDGVGNPHNLGAILRNAAHFGVSGLLLPSQSDLQLSGAAARVAEGGAEVVPWVRMGDAASDIDALHRAGFVLAATLVEGGEDVFASPLPPRLVWVMGAEQSGMDRDFARRCDRRVSIPGTGAVESLNVASATAVLLAAWAHRRG